MGPYFAVISTRLDRSPLEAARLPRDRIAVLLGEYKYLAESMAGQYGSLHSAFASEGHMFLFESPDAALQYALRLMKPGGATTRHLQPCPRLPICLSVWDVVSVNASSCRQERDG